MHTIDVLRLRAVFSAEIIQSYHLPQFYYITNIKIFG